jgi:hypothetical protein
VQRVQGQAMSLGRVLLSDWQEHPEPRPPGRTQASHSSTRSGASLDFHFQIFRDETEAKLRSQNSGNPFVVFVDPGGDPKPAVASWGYRRDFTDLSKHAVLWLPHSDN